MMPWVRLDDGFYDHPKFLRAGGAGYLALKALAYSNHHLTDGFVPNEAVDQLAERKSDASRLVAVGLWTRVEGGYQIHDFSDYQALRIEVEAKRSSLSHKRSEAGRRGAAKRWQSNGNPE